MDDLDQRNIEALRHIIAAKESKRKARGGIGATRIKLAKIVSECLGINCQPEDLQPAKGAYRTDKRLDVYAWEVFATTHTGLQFWAGAFETMTECVKAGKVHLIKGEIYSGEKSE